MKIHVNKILIVFATFALLSCEKDFLDINDDPNNPLDASLQLLLPSTQLDMAGALGTNGGGMSQITMSYMHHTVQRSSGQNDYAIQGVDFGVTAPWLTLYSRSLADLEIIIRKSEEQEAFPYLGIAQVMKAYIYSLLVDVYGDVPLQKHTRPRKFSFPSTIPEKKFMRNCLHSLTRVSLISRKNQSSKSVAKT